MNFCQLIPGIISYSSKHGWSLRNFLRTTSSERMLIYQTLGLLIFLAVGIYSQDVRMPPDIITGPIPHIVFRPDDVVDLSCIAVGSPKPRYEWTKDGVYLDPNSPNIRWLGSDGTIQLKEDTTGSRDQGYYQCKAINSYGTAMSVVSFVEMAALGSFTSSIVKPYFVLEGTPFSLPCEPLKSIPAPVYSWSLVKTVDDTTSTAYLPSKRVQIENNGGALYFSYASSSDTQPGNLYKCNVFNSFLDVTKGGSYANVTITPGSIPQTAPVLQYSTSSPIIGLIGKDVKFRCIFSGSPEATVTWSKVGGTLPSRFIPNDALYSTQATLSKLEQSDEGTFRCTGSNPSASNVVKDITLKVEAVPVFLNSTSQPRSTNATDGESVTFQCIATAIPVASVVWYRDGTVLTRDSLPPKYRISGDGLSLTITNLCKTCADGKSDLTVIQCNASNVHGSVFGQGYVNILSKTKIQVEATTPVWEPSKQIEFRCNALSDDSTPVSYKWFHNGNEIFNDSRMNFDENKRVLIVTTGSNNIEGASDIGTYTCNATNGYSWETVDHKLIPPPGFQPVSAAANLWWIAIVLAIIIIILILILLCYTCLQRNKGESYFVDDAEVKAGNDPAKELLDSGFHDYQRLGNDQVRGSQNSLSKSLGGAHSEDDSSLNAYASPSESKFREDGSFVGQYDNTKKK